MTLLIVDDEPLLRELLYEELEYRGYQVLTAESADEAWQILQERDVEVVISDIRMPGRSGIDLLKQIRAHKPVVPRVFLLSGYSDITQEAARALGATAVLSKPYNINDLVDVLEAP